MFKSTTTTFGNNNSDNYIKVNGRNLQIAAKELIISVKNIIDRETEKFNKEEKERKDNFAKNVNLLAMSEGSFVAFCMKYAEARDYHKKEKEAWYKKSKYKSFDLASVFFDFMYEEFPDFDGRYVVKWNVDTDYQKVLEDTTDIRKYYQEVLSTLYFVCKKLQDCEQIKLANDALQEIERFRQITGDTVFMNLHDYNRIYKKGMIVNTKEGK